MLENYNASMRTAKNNLSMKDALRVKSAEMWLRLGEPFQAFQELQRLTRRAWRHPWTERVFWRVAQSML
jgi:hypothetical protein